ncbi:hypothetical protein EMCRGX_G029244 [Ephydatia muelleri]
MVIKSIVMERRIDGRRHTNFWSLEDDVHNSVIAKRGDSGSVVVKPDEVDGNIVAVQLHCEAQGRQVEWKLSRTPSAATVAPQLAAAITEATVESSDNFAIIREAQAKDVYMASVLEAVMQGKPPPGIIHQHGKILFTKECFVGVTKNPWPQSLVFRC